MQPRFSKPLVFNRKYANEKVQISVSPHPQGNSTQIINKSRLTVRGLLRKVCTCTGHSTKLIFNLLNTEDFLNNTQDIPIYQKENI